MLNSITLFGGNGTYKVAYRRVSTSLLDWVKRIKTQICPTSHDDARTSNGN
jgi:hypothetical protein